MTLARLGQSKRGAPNLLPKGDLRTPVRPPRGYCAFRLDHPEQNDPFVRNAGIEHDLSMARRASNVPATTTATPLGGLTCLPMEQFQREESGYANEQGTKPYRRAQA